MTLDVELYRRTVYAPAISHVAGPRHISVIDIHPEGATRTLLLLHGYGGSAMQWLYQLRFFGQTMRVIAPDMRGHGLSDDPPGLPYTMNALVDDLELVLDALQVQGPIHVIAHSFGGALATEYALLHADTVESLVLIGVPTRFIVHPLLVKLMNIPDPVFSRVAKTIRVALYAQQRTLKNMHDRLMSTWRGDERVQQLRVATLVVLGHRDRVFLRQNYEDMVHLIPRAQQVVIPVSAHLVQLERPDAVNRAISRFIEKQDTAARTGVINHAPTHAARLIEMPWLQNYDNGVPEQIPLPRQLLHDFLGNAARSFPDRPAIIFFGQKIAYRELDLLSNRFAHALQGLGLKRGDRVAIVLPNVPQCIIAFYGTLKAGGIVVLGSPLSNEQEIHYQLRDSGAEVLLTFDSYRSEVERVCTDTSIKHVIYTNVREYLPIPQRVRAATIAPAASAVDEPSGGGASRAGASPAPTIGSRGDPGVVPSFRMYFFQHLLRSHPARSLDSATTSNDLALIQYTSGTTDVAKGVMLSHGNLVVNVAQVRHWMPRASIGREVILGVLPISHSYGITNCVNLASALASTLILLPTTRVREVLEAIKRYHPTIFPGIPAFYLAIANYPHVRSYGVSAIRICVSGSAPLPVEVQEAFEKLTRGRLVEGYGLTEASPVTHSNPLEGERRVGSIGIPLPGTNARIVHIETGEPLPAGQVGELLIRGPQVMQGYWHMPEETAQTLQDGWLHTGDLARMDEDGFFTIIDRKKDLILSGPYNVYPRDVEEVLYEHPKVLEAAVVAHRFIEGAGSVGEGVAVGTEGGVDESGRTLASSNASPFIKAVVVLKRGEQATADELLAYARERLDAYKVPRQIEFRTELPKNPVGKVLRRLLIET